MPLPFGHSLVAYSVYEATPLEKKVPRLRMILLFAVVANLPDLDFIPGFLAGDPNRYHHHYLSHSLGFALFIGALLGWFFSLKYGKRFLSGFLIFSGVCFSHMILDFFTKDSGAPFGLPILWPLSEQYFLSPISIFMSVNKGGPNLEFIRSLLVLNNLWVILWEVAVLLPVVFVVRVLKSKQWLRPWQVKKI